MNRWLAACKPFGANDLREAARRFDRIILRGCFNCDPKRNPKYLLAIVRTIRDERKPLRQARHRDRLWKQKHQEARQVVDEQERQRNEHPEQAAHKAVELAKVALENKGFGIVTATRWLDQALCSMASRGPDAYRLATRCLTDKEKDHRLLTWMIERIEASRPPPRSLKEDLLL